MAGDSLPEKLSNFNHQYKKYADTPEDRKLLRKVDLHLLPVLTLLYLLSFLDRIVGLAIDLHLSPPEYNTALALYFVSYVIFEVPSNIMYDFTAHSFFAFSSQYHPYTSLKRFDPRFWLSSLTFFWGIASICQGLIKDKAGLFGIRFLLGVTEAGLFPGVIYVFSVCYRRHERGWRVAIFFGGAALAGAFGGILAYAIGKMDGIGGRKGWEWIFILEGILTVAISLAAFFLVPSWSYKASFLSEDEREMLRSRLRADSDAGEEEQFQWIYVFQAFKDHLVWGYAFLFHGFAFALYSLSLFLPTIIAELGYASWKAQLLTIPPNALATLSIWAVVWLSSRANLKAPFIMGSAAIACAGYIILITTHTAGAQYVGIHLAAAGVYAGNALLLSWPGENVSGQTKRAVAVAMQITIGDIGAIAGVLIYRPNLSANHFRKPHMIAIGYLVFAIFVTTYLAIWMRRQNQRRDLLLLGESGEKIHLRAEGLCLGDRSVYYRYVY